MWIRFNTTGKYWESASDPTDPATLFTQLDVDAAAIVSGNLAVARMPVSGTWALAGDLTISGAKVNVPTPTTNTEAATKLYVDTAVGGVDLSGLVPYTGATGAVTLGAYTLRAAALGVGAAPATAGIVIPDAVPTPTTDALYNDAGTLKFNGSAIVSPNTVLTTGSYADPTWITSLAGSKITGTAPITLYTNTTAGSNVGTAETTLVTVTVAGGTLAADGQVLTIVAIGTFAANGNNKTVKLKFDGTTVATIGPDSFSSNGWQIYVQIIRLGATSEYSYGYNIIPTAVPISSIAPTARTWTLANNLDVVVTGRSSAASDDVTYRALTVSLLRVA